MSFTLSGASLANALAILRVKLSLRRLPTITTTLYGLAMGFPFDADAGWLPCRQPSQLPKRCKCMDCGNWARLRTRAVVRKNGSQLYGTTLAALVRIDQVLFAGRALAIDGDVVELQRLLQRHHLRVVAGQGGFELRRDPLAQR